MNEILLATANDHKRTEINRLMPGIRLSLPSEAGILFDVPEDGNTFYENALIKARFLHEKTGKPVLADDSGLCVDALNGEPGIYAARYGSVPGGPKLESADRNRYLLSKMEHTENRRAFFVCCMVLVVDPYRVFSVQETVEGYITRQPAGSGGFGYDPVFFVPEAGKTMAELTEDEKNILSHRGRAGRVMLRILSGLPEKS